MLKGKWVVVWEVVGTYAGCRFVVPYVEAMRGRMETFIFWSGDVWERSEVDFESGCLDTNEGQKDNHGSSTNGRDSNGV